MTLGQKGKRGRKGLIQSEIMELCKFKNQSVRVSVAVPVVVCLNANAF